VTTGKPLKTAPGEPQTQEDGWRSRSCEQVHPNPFHREQIDLPNSDIVSQRTNCNPCLSSIWALLPMTVLVIYACAISVSLMMLGRRYPEHRAWSYVDAIYYPLGIAGVCFLFLSSLDTKETAARQLDATFEVISKEMELAADVSKAYLELSRFVDRPREFRVACQEETKATEFQATPCVPNGTGISAFAASVSQVKDNRPDADYAPACNGFANNRKHLAGKQPLKLLFGELTDAEYRRATDLIEAIGGACIKYLEALTRPREERVAETMLIEQRQQPAAWHRNSLFGTLLLYGKEWLWPFVLVFALALKVGKSSAGLKHTRET